MLLLLEIKTENLYQKSSRTAPLNGKSYGKFNNVRGQMALFQYIRGNLRGNIDLLETDQIPTSTVESVRYLSVDEQKKSKLPKYDTRAGITF